MTTTPHCLARMLLCFLFFTGVTLAQKTSDPLYEQGLTHLCRVWGLAK